MKHLSLILLLLFSTTCWGEWIPVTDNAAGISYYIDYERVKERGEYVYYWVLGDYLEPNPRGNMSDIAYEIGDCEMFRHKSLQSTFYRRSMGEGESTPVSESTISKQTWTFPSADSAAKILLNLVCGIVKW